MPAGIQVTCRHCGKVLRINEKYSGKVGQCPNCRGEIKISRQEQFKKEDVPHQENVKSCPTCGAYLNPDDLICISCYTNLATGEWDMQRVGYTPEKTTYPFLKIAFVSLVLLGIFIVAIGIKLSKSRTPNVQPPTTHVTTNIPTKKTPVVDNVNEEMESQLSEISKLPEDSYDHTREKIEKYERWINKYEQKECSRMLAYLKELENKEEELQAEEMYQNITKREEGDVFTELTVLNSFPPQYENTSAGKKINERKEKILKQIADLIKIEKEKIEKYSLEQEYIKALAVSTSDLMRTVASLIMYPNLKKEFEDISIISDKAKKALFLDIPLKDGKAENISQIRERFNVFVPILLNMMKERRYTEAQDKLKILIGLLQPLENSPEKESLQGEIQSKLQDISSIPSFFVIAGEGIKKSEGKKEKFLTIKGETIEGVIGRYENMEIYIVSQGNVIIKLPFMHLSTDKILYFANKSREDKDVHLSGAVFAMYEREFDLARKELKIAEKYGATPKEVSNYEEKIAQASKK